MRHVGDSSKLMTDAVAGTPINPAETSRCEPNRELAVEATARDPPDLRDYAGNDSDSSSSA